MNIRLDSTSFRSIFRSLSIYSEKSRAEGIAAKMKWAFNKNVRIYGYDSPHQQIRLSVVQLDSNKLESFYEGHPSFLTEVPTTRGLGTIAGENKIKIDTRAEQDNLRVSTENFTYNLKRRWKTRSMNIENHYLPIDQIKTKTSVSSTKLKSFLSLTQGGPIELIVDNKSLKMTAETDTEKASLDLYNDMTGYSINYLYDRSVMSEAIKKFPHNKNVQIVANDDIIRFRYEIDDNLGSVNYYQRGKVST